MYEYFLSRFAADEGKGGGEFYTPQCVVKLLVRMIEPYKGRVYDPCSGSGGMFVQSDWGGKRLREDARWTYHIPPVNNANYQEELGGLGV